MTQVNIEAMKPLAPFTTLEVGGPARFFAEVQSEWEIEEAASWASSRRLPLFILGGGSNLLVSDNGFNGLVLHIALKGIQVSESASDPSARLYQVAAGEGWDQFVQRAVENEYAGIECLAGIPGTAGGTPVQNVGAYGQEVASTVERVRVFDLRERVFAEFTASECGFAYRRSRFNTGDRGRYVVTRVDYRLRSGGTPTLAYADLQHDFPEGSNPTMKQVAETVRRIRLSKGMLLVDGDPDCRSAGSFFKNPIVTENQAAAISVAAASEPPRFRTGSDHPGMVKLSAAWLIQKAGFARGYTLGRAAISGKHTLALVNRGGATAAEIMKLAETIRAAVQDRFSLSLEIEPVLVGFAGQ